MAVISNNFQIYHDMGAQLIAEISMYPGISEEQLCLLHPDIGKQLKHTLVYLKKQKRIEKDPRGRLFPAGRQADSTTDSVSRAVWVLLDFLPDVEHYTSSGYPVILAFFMRGEEYQVIHAPQGREALTLAIIGSQADCSARRILLIDTPTQIAHLQRPGICGYCTVQPDGYIQYYQSARKGDMK